MNEQIRIAAFDWLEQQVRLYDEVLPRKLLESGFYLHDQHITLVGPQGIWKPKACEFPLSITTIANSPYDDRITRENFLQYRYRGKDPYHPDNVRLRKMMQRQIPLIYFLGIDKGKYLATWPVFIIQDDMSALTFTVAVDESKAIMQEIVKEDPETFYRRSYLTTQTMQRLHQKSFRERVLAAYQNQCALCRLRHRELLDTAHIISDTQEHGDPIVQNGLSLCKIHHAAFDQFIIGISPDYLIKIRHDILEETDGPMLKYGIQSLENQKIILPPHRKDWPDRERLEQRFQLFQR